MAKIADDLPETGARDDVREACVALFASRQFARSPVMRKLLAFLVEKSLAGEGDRLKAYTIAVDALGKSAEFDAQMDSYPRVQVGRLRNLLDSYYAESEGDASLRLQIPKGAYVVQFGEAAATLSAPKPANDQTSPAKSEPIIGKMGRMAAAAAAGAAITLIATQSFNGGNNTSGETAPISSVTDR